MQEPFGTNEKGHLTIGGKDAVELANTYQTPLFVYDVARIRENCRAFMHTFQKRGVKFQVAYASKAFSSIAILQVMKQEGLSIDVVSSGELYTALQADFPPEKIHYHGNNKSIDELEMAVEHQIGCIVIDNFLEIEQLGEILERKQQQMDVLIRVTPGIESETHRYIMTGNEDSKFGFDVKNGQAEKAFQQLKDHKYMKFKGLHCHLGSQLFDTNSYTTAIDVLFHALANWKESYHYTPEIINVGGGFGIRYTDTDKPIPLEMHVDAIVTKVKENAGKWGIPMPEIWIEPGRSIVGDACTTLYTIGASKQIPDVRQYLAVDGGMTDNLRPALYQAQYHAVLANKAAAPIDSTVSIAGKCCESGDMLIWDLPLASAEQGDILAVFATGAYGYSMANNYNRFPRPAVVFVENGQDQLVIKRESLEDIIQHDLSYEG
ncbi:diaminopimelate decarboxylase [Ornithinibacillus gellani]|uniref:diaminopimelate decarboxylase n=1 Tax=Ornithinibacillus gellani TaxID=2293253 RepID=UPI000F482802|nr:diaminopimelate decarboxylase [Ornithinibacillus gellani]